MNKQAYLEEIYNEAYNDELEKISGKAPSTVRIGNRIMSIAKARKKGIVSSGKVPTVRVGNRIMGISKARKEGIVSS